MTNGSITLRPSRRAGNILRVLVREYIRSGRPVGSRRLSGLCQEGLSPATIRSVTAHLEELGFLKQPHRSAGRVPTETGYRFYADSLSKASELSPKELLRIRGTLEKEMDPENLMSKTSQILSTHSDSMGFVLAHPEVTTAIVGTQDPSHMRDNIERIENGPAPSSAVVEELHRRFDQLEEGWPQLT